jgi:hypothetical protein
MPTLLQAVNETLLSVGELEVLNLTTPVSRKAVNAIQGAINFIPRLHTWRYFRNTVVAISWSGPVATLLPFQECYDVYDDTNILIRRNPIDLEHLNVQAPTVGVAAYYATYAAGENKILVYPEPSAAKKLTIKFRVLSEPTIPTQANDIIQLSDPLYRLMLLYAQIIMHRVHTTDFESLAATQRQFEIEAQYLRTRDNLSVTSYMSGA